MTALGAGRSLANTPLEDPLLTVEEVAAYLTVPVKTLYQWRFQNSGPASFRVGRYLRYRASTVHAWLNGMESAA